MTESRPLATPTERINNDRVRVTEWRFQAGAETGHHIHEFDYIVVPVTTGKLLMIDKFGVETIAELTAGMPYFRDAGVEHNVINHNSTEFIFIEVELL